MTLVQPHNPATGEKLDSVLATTPAQLQGLLEAAEAARPVYAALPAARRADFLDAAAEQIRAHTDELVHWAGLETGLPEARLRGEAARTANQLALFAALVREGSWVDARIDTPQPQRQPLPKPDVRSLRVPLGVVAVFGASNFPLAFSVAGGDTASALAAGCPVIVKAHPAHPHTSGIAARALQGAAQASGMPAGTVQIVFEPGVELGQHLVRSPVVKAVGFTGSRAGGLALLKLAQGRPVPIPVFAEMSSVNPLVIASSALARPNLAAGLAASISGSGGQLCTQPGLLFVPTGDAGEALLRDLAARLQDTQPCALLTRGIRDAYGQGIARLAEGAEALTPALPGDLPAASQLFQVPLEGFRQNPALAHEVFGPSSLAVRYDDPAQLPEVLAALEGQLTASLHADPAELPHLADVLAVMRERAGRVILNGFPTGVEVGHAMVHGGPFPATSDGQSTSVGTRAIERFSRPFAYQDFPDSALPPELQNANPLGLWRVVDGQRTQQAITQQAISPSKESA